MGVMYDDVTVGLIPPDPPAVAGYVDGSFANYNEMVASFPNAQHVSIAVHDTEDADALDCEGGDALTSQFGPWAVRQRARKGLGWRPIGYAAVSNMQALIESALAAGLSLADFRTWSAHTGHGPHLCGPQCGFGLQHVVNATQWDWMALGRNLDESLLDDEFFTPPKPPKPKDPHHYYWFTDAVRREHVMTYDELRRHPLKNRKELKRLREQLKHGAHSVALGVINRAKISGKPRDWSHDRAGWRYQALIHRANGKRVVK